MPPEPRKMMESMMARRDIGMNMVGGVITLKTCITKEQAERNVAPRAAGSGPTAAASSR